MARFYGGRWLPGGLLVVLIFAQILTGVWLVQQNQQGVVLRFGRVVRTVGAGMHFTLPWPLESMRLVPTTEVRTLPIGFARDDALPLDDEALWRLSGDTNILELRARVLYTIKQPADYLFNVADFADGPRDLAIRYVVEAVLTEILATMPVDEVLAAGKTQIPLAAMRKAQTQLDKLSLGVQISAINIIDVKPPAAVIAAFNDVASAKSDRERNITEANGYAMQLLPQARAAANNMVQQAQVYSVETVNRARGAAQSFAALARETGHHPKLTWRRLWLEAAERIVGKGRIIVFERPADGGKFRLYLEE